MAVGCVVNRECGIGDCAFAGCAIVLLAITVLLEIATFIMSIIYINDCELAPELPICLIVEFSVYLLIVVYWVTVVYPGKLSKIKCGENCSLLILCCTVLIVPVSLWVLHMCVSGWMTNVHDTYYEEGRCNNTSTATPFAVTPSRVESSSHSHNFQEHVFFATTESFSTNQHTNNASFTATANQRTKSANVSLFGTIQRPMNTSSGAASCPSCNKQFVDFIFPVSTVRLLTVWIIVFALCGFGIVRRN